MKERIRNKIISMSNSRIVQSILLLVVVSVMVICVFFPDKFTVGVECIWIIADILLMTVSTIAKTNADVLEKNKLITILLNNELMVIGLSLMTIASIMLIANLFIINIYQLAIFEIIVIIPVIIIARKVYKYFQKKMIY